jgi:hypothetical protein
MKLPGQFLLGNGQFRPVPRHELCEPVVSMFGDAGQDVGTSPIAETGAWPRNDDPLFGQMLRNGLRAGRLRVKGATVVVLAAASSTAAAAPAPSVTSPGPCCTAMNAHKVSLRAQHHRLTSSGQGGPHRRPTTLPAMPVFLAPVSRPASGRHAELLDDGGPSPFHLDRSRLSRA